MHRGSRGSSGNLPPTGNAPSRSARTDARKTPGGRGSQGVEELAALAEDQPKQPEQPERPARPERPERWRRWARYEPEVLGQRRRSRSIALLPGPARLPEEIRTSLLRQGFPEKPQRVLNRELLPGNVGDPGRPTWQAESWRLV